MRFLLALILGIAIGGMAVWIYRDNAEPRLHSAGRRIQTAAESAQENVQEKLRSMHLNAGDITNELARTGRVIREKVHEAGEAISNATADARVTASIKTKLARDNALSAWDISVNTTDGVVTLSGTAPSADAIGKAMLVAMETDGVRQVISTLQVKPR
jgi:hyperosmotically inducible periplasmic protein